MLHTKIKKTMALNNTKQSHLEKKSIEKRQEELVRSEYNKSELVRGMKYPHTD